MTNQTLIKMLPSESLAPSERMTVLADVSQQLMKARIKALTSGLDAIHDELATLSRKVRGMQKELLDANPELVLMAFE